MPANTVRQFVMLQQDTLYPELVEAYPLDLTKEFLVGNSSSRFVVRDEDGEGNPVFWQRSWDSDATTHDNLIVTMDSRKQLAPGAANDPRFHQINLFAVCAHTLEFVEEELGRDIAWASGRPLILRPHAFKEANAYYDPSDVSLNFGYFGSLFRPGTVWLCLSHDVIAHELGHAILDNFRPLFNYATHPDTHAFHESFGDILAMLSALEHDNVVAAIYGEDGIDLNTPNLISETAEEFGEGLEGISGAYLRSAFNEVTYHNAPEEPHDRSNLLTAAFYEILTLLAHMAPGRHVANPPENPEIEPQHVQEAANQLKGIVLRTLNYLPPTGVGLPTLARIVLEADTLVFGSKSPDENDAMAAVFEDRYLLETPVYEDALPLSKTETSALGTIFDNLVATRDDAAAHRAINRWVVENAEALQVPLEVNPTLLQPSLERTERGVDRIYTNGEKEVVTICEYVLQYGYELPVESEFGPVLVKIGYTLVLDDAWSPLLLIGEDELWVLHESPQRYYPFWEEMYAEALANTGYSAEDSDEPKDEEPGDAAAVRARRAEHPPHQLIARNLSVHARHAGNLGPRGSSGNVGGGGLRGTNSHVGGGRLRGTNSHVGGGRLRGTNSHVGGGRLRGATDAAYANCVCPCCAGQDDAAMQALPFTLDRDSWGAAVPRRRTMCFRHRMAHRASVGEALSRFSQRAVTRLPAAARAKAKPKKKKNAKAKRKNGQG